MRYHRLLSLMYIKPPRWQAHSPVRVGHGDQFDPPPRWTGRGVIWACCECARKRHGRELFSQAQQIGAYLFNLKIGQHRVGHAFRIVQTLVCGGQEAAQGFDGRTGALRD